MDLLVSVNGRKMGFQNSKLKIYNRNNQAVLKSESGVLSLSRGYNISSDKNPAPVEIKHENNRIIVHNNSENLIVKLNDEKVGVSDSVLCNRTDTINHIAKIEILARRKYSVSNSLTIRQNVEYNKSPNDVIQYNESENEPVHRSDISNILQESPDATLIGSGEFRDVYRVDMNEIDALSESDGSIVKVATNNKGLKANKSELQTWQAVMGTKNRSLFCPITPTSPSDKYIVMKEAKNIEPRNNIMDTMREVITSRIDVDLEEDYEKAHPFRMGGWDIKKSNIGQYEGKTVLIDYPYGGKFKIKNDEIREEFRNVLEQKT